MRVDAAVIRMDGSERRPGEWAHVDFVGSPFGPNSNPVQFSTWKAAIDYVEKYGFKQSHEVRDSEYRAAFYLRERAP